VAQVVVETATAILLQHPQTGLQALLILAEVAVAVLEMEVLALMAVLGLSSFVGLHLFQHPLPQLEALR
jgi:hypothetical protein